MSGDDWLAGRTRAHLPAERDVRGGDPRYRFSACGQWALDQAAKPDQPKCARCLASQLPRGQRIIGHRPTAPAVVAAPDPDLVKLLADALANIDGGTAWTRVPFARALLADPRLRITLGTETPETPQERTQEPPGRDGTAPAGVRTLGAQNDAEEGGWLDELVERNADAAEAKFGVRPPHRRQEGDAR
jgi:hypothetical protein